MWCSIWRWRRSFFGTIIERLGEAGLAEERNGAGGASSSKSRSAAISRSARALNARILKVLSRATDLPHGPFPRQGNGPEHHGAAFLQRRSSSRSGTATTSTTCRSRPPKPSGVERRASFYETTGALRDMVPNHVFQLLSLTAMESPNSFAADAVRSEKAKVLEAIAPLDCEDVRRNVVRGQYADGHDQRCSRCKAIARSRVSTPTARPRPMSPCSSGSTIGAGPGCRFICAPASG